MAAYLATDMGFFLKKNPLKSKKMRKNSREARRWKKLSVDFGAYLMYNRVESAIYT